ncbi:hypothetical protein [Pseudomonas fluorescens]|uniref:hypothetical protein n=1 Tax=Pseudomonas fluorescens TaxID=294 RepID=UPI00123FBEA6|nr:hypothetical protein [Pseudomonas fluorescens]VVO53035.1 hypothetical protein PS898_00386 [Pseudomonas fluorescens]
MKTRSVLSESDGSTTRDNERCLLADAAERKEIADALEVLVSSKEGELISLKAERFSLREHSSLGCMIKPLKRELNDFIKRYHPDGVVLVTNRSFEPAVAEFDDWDQIRFRNRVIYDPYAQPYITYFMSVADQVGGFMSSVIGEASYAQWLCFHGMKVPAVNDREQIRKLAAFLKWEYRAPEAIESYWEQLEGHEADSVKLTASQYEEVRAMTAQYVQGGKSLLDTLYERVRPVLHDGISWGNADDVIHKLIYNSFSYGLARKYIAALGWWGAASGESLDNKDLAQMLYTALILDLDSQVGGSQQRNVIAGHDIYESSRSADETLEKIRQDFEEHLVSNKKVSRKLAPLASHLVLSSAAPGLLVKNIPSWLKAGSVGWVTFCQAVSIYELISKGGVRFLEYKEVMQFADIDSLSHALGQLQGVLAIEAIIDWALINEVISRSDLEGSVNAASDRAVAAYETFLEAMVNTATAFAPVPDRKQLALATLRQALPDAETDFFEQRILRPHHFSDFRASILDLYIEGTLDGHGWNWSQEPHIMHANPGLAGLPQNQHVFETEVRKFHGNIHRAIKTNLKLGLAGMPREDREILGRSAIAFFTVREPDTKQEFPQGSGSGVLGAGSANSRTVQVCNINDKARGRYGVIMIASYDNNKMRCYELFSMTGECRRNDALGDFVLSSGVMEAPARLVYGSDGKGPLPEFYRAPLHVKKYVGDGSRPTGFMNVFIEKLGAIPAPTRPVENKNSIYQYFVSPHFEDIANFVVMHRPVGSVSELVESLTVLTDKEMADKKYERFETWLVNLTIPFKKCVEDLRSGDRNLLVDGIYGCTMDAIGIVFAVLGVPAKILGIAAKSISLAAKLLKTAKYCLTLTVSILNPIDAALPLLIGFGLKQLKNGIKLGHQAARLLGKANAQIFRLTGRHKYIDMLKAASLSRVGKGKWRALGATVDISSVLAVSRNKRWYALNSRGNPWGKALDGFDLKSLVLIPSIRPIDYTIHVIRNGMSIAGMKLKSAISVLARRQFALKTDLAIGLFLGSTNKARDKLSAVMEVVRLDFNGTSISNFFLDIAKVDNQIIQVDQSKYSDWKKAGLQERDNFQYLQVSTQHLNDRFNAASFSYGEVADDLIHEMVCAGPRKTELVSAKAARLNDAPALNVAPLLNLAAGRLPKSDGTGAFYNSDDAVSNADSIAVLASLLAQLDQAPAQFEKNFEIMTDAVIASRGQTIKSEVLIRLNSV